MTSVSKGPPQNVSCDGATSEQRSMTRSNLTRVTRHSCRRVPLKTVRSHYKLHGRSPIVPPQSLGLQLASNTVQVVMVARASHLSLKPCYHVPRTHAVRDESTRNRLPGATFPVSDGAVPPTSKLAYLVHGWLVAPAPKLRDCTRCPPTSRALGHSSVTPHR
jgi:hypothetical protein